MEFESPYGKRFRYKSGDKVKIIRGDISLNGVDVTGVLTVIDAKWEGNALGFWVVTVKTENNDRAELSKPKLKLIKRRWKMKNFRGEELYIYPPDTFQKPILILSRTKGEFAIMFQESLNHFSLLSDGLKGKWIIINTTNTSQFIEWKRKLQSKKSWEFYLDVYDKYHNRQGENK